MARIFVVEDDASLRDELMRLLELQGHTALTSTAFDHIVDDIMGAAVVMLTSSDSEFDEVMSMNLGADDYVTKPYNPAVLLARIQSVMRRSQRQEPPARIAHRGVVLDVARGRVEHDGKSVDLTRNELKILHMLMANHDAIISRQELMVELWQSDAFIDDNTLTVNINRLRKSLSSIGVPDDFLITRRGQGYVV